MRNHSKLCVLFVVVVALPRLAAAGEPGAEDVSVRGELSDAAAASERPPAAGRAPWQLGPSPSAAEVERGWFVDASLGGIAGGYEPLGAARLRVGATPTRWLHASLAYERRGAWRMCPDCLTDAFVLTARASVVRSRYVQVSPWLVTQMTTTTALDVMPGLAVEAGSRRLRVDLSAPLWSSYDLLTTIRIAPEAGLRAHWSAAHATRVSVAGADLAVGVEHRWRLSERWTLSASLRRGEEGTGGEVGLRFGG